MKPTHPSRRFIIQTYKKTLFSLFFLIFGVSPAFAAPYLHFVWQQTNVSNCQAQTSPGGAGWTGAVNSSDGTWTLDVPKSNYTTPGTTAYTFTIVCSGGYTDPADGLWKATTLTRTKTLNITNTVQLYVSGGNSAAVASNPFLPSPSISLTADQAVISYGYKAVLRWAFYDVNGTCTQSGWNTWSGASGASSGVAYGSTNNRATDDPSQTTENITYSLTCRATDNTVLSASKTITYRYKYIADAGCFTKGTMVTMANGEKKDIALVKPGEYILSSYGPEQVKKKYEINYSGDVYAFNGSENYFVTPTHPFMTTEGWKSFDPEGSKKETPGLEVTKLAVGDTLIMKDGKLEKLEKIDKKKLATTVYNFGVNGSHDFYADEYQVHNVNLGVFIPRVEAIMATQKP